MGSALIISLRKRRIRCPTRSKHRLYLPFVRQKRGGLPKGPLHVRRGALRRAVPAALSGPGGLHCRRQCPGEGSYTTAPLSFGLCPLPLPANLSVLLTLPCPGALPLPFHPTPSRTCPQALACSLPFGKKRKNPRSSMLRSLNKHRLLHLLLPLLPS